MSVNHELESLPHAQQSQNQIISTLPNASGPGKERTHCVQCFSDQDVEKRLSVAKQGKPIGINMLQTVDDKYGEYCRNNGQTPRNTQAWRSKFDKLVNISKHTGEAYCPPLVKITRQMVKDILSHLNAVNIGVI